MVSRRRKPDSTKHSPPVKLLLLPMLPASDSGKAYFETLGLDIRDEWSFFKLLDQDGDGIVETWPAGLGPRSTEAKFVLMLFPCRPYTMILQYTAEPDYLKENF